MAAIAPRRRLAARLAAAAAAPAAGLDPACWPPGHGFSWELCCQRYESGGLHDCWVDGFTFAQCCAPEPRSTVDEPLLVPASSRSKSLARQLPGASVAEVEGGLEVQWRAQWSCPPGSPAEPASSSAEPHPDATDELWTAVYLVQTLAAAKAQSSPHNASAAPLLASFLRFAAALGELRCALLYWGHASEEWRPAQVMVEVCALIDLVLLQLWSLGVTALAGLVSLGPGFCGAWQADVGPLANIAEGVAHEVSEHFIAQGLSHWQEKGMAHLSGEAAAKRGGRAVLSHPALPAELVPSCARLRSSPATRLLGSGDGPAVGVTGGLSWALGIGRAMAALGAGPGSILVNLGAEDGGCHQDQRMNFWNYDPANCLVERDGWAGVLVEGNATSFARLQQRLGGRRNLLCTLAYIEPDSLRQTLLDAPPGGGAGPVEEAERIKARIKDGEVDLLKIDLDFGDCDFAEALLRSGLRPRAVHVEVNPLFPPPVAYRQHFSGALLRSRGLPGEFMGLLAGGEWRPWRIGCSLTAYHMALGGPEAYALAQMEFDHAFFVRRDLAPRLPLADVAGPALRPRDLWLQAFHCDALRGVIRRDDEAAGFDFRRWARACAPPGGGEPSEDALQDVVASARELLRRDGGHEVAGRHHALDAPPGKIPFSLWIEEDY